MGAHGHRAEESGASEPGSGLRWLEGSTGSLQDQGLNLGWGGQGRVLVRAQELTQACERVSASVCISMCICASVCVCVSLSADFCLCVCVSVRRRLPHCWGGSISHSLPRLWVSELTKPQGTGMTSLQGLWEALGLHWDFSTGSSGCPGGCSHVPLRWCPRGANPTVCSLSFLASPSGIDPSLHCRIRSGTLHPAWTWPLRSHACGRAAPFLVPGAWRPEVLSFAPSMWCQ